MGLWVVAHGAGLESLRPWELLSALTLLAFVAGRLLHCLLHTANVTGSMLFGAAALYLLLGFLWAHAYSLAAVVDPTAFGSSPPDWNALTYFSFSTLTTLGIGDLAPVSPLARSLTALKATTGVLYIGLIVARFAAVARRSP